MSQYNNGGTARTVAAANKTLSAHRNNITTASQIKSLARLHGDLMSLTDHAEQLVVDMKAIVPIDGLVSGTLHQLEGKRLHDTLCTHILVFAGSHAVFTDLSTGIVVTVDSFGRRRTSTIGVVR